MSNMIQVRIKTVKQIKEEWRDLDAYVVRLHDDTAQEAAEKFVNMLSIASITTPIHECRWNWAGSPQGHYFTPVYK